MRNIFKDGDTIFFAFFYLLLVCTISILTYYEGLYWDDWNFHRIIFTRDNQGVLDYFAVDRPIAGYIKLLFKSILTNNIWFWHLFLIFTKIIYAWSIILVLRMFIGFDKFIQFWIFGLILVFPGFSQDPISFVYSTFYLPITFYNCSLYLSYKLLRLDLFGYNINGITIWVASIVLAFLGFIQLEYLLGLEIVRLVLFYRDMRFKDKLKYIVQWLGNALAALGFLVYRVFIFQPGRKAVSHHDFLNAWITEPLNSLVELSRTIFMDFFQILVKVWTLPFKTDFFLKTQLERESHYSDLLILHPKVQIVLSLVALGVVLSILLFNKSFDKTPKVDIPTKINKKHIALIFALGLSSCFVWFAGRNIELEELYDRYILHLVFLSILALVWFFKKIKLPKTYYLIYLVICTFWYVQNSLDYIQDFRYQKSFYEQIAWRLPNLPKGSLVAVDGIKFKHQRDKALAAGLNYLYDNDTKNEKQDYWIDFYPYWQGSKGYFRQSDTIERQGYSFNIDPELIFHVNFTDKSCLKIRYPKRIDDEFKVNTSQKSLDEIIALGNSEKANLDFDVMKIFFGNGFNNKNCWCYHYQKADHHFVKAEYQQIVDILYKIKDNKKLRPVDLKEYFIFYKSAKMINDRELMKYIEDAMRKSILVNELKYL